MQAEVRWKVDLSLLAAKRPISTKVRMMVRPDREMMMAPLTLFDRKAMMLAKVLDSFRSSSLEGSITYTK